MLGRCSRTDWFRRQSCSICRCQEWAVWGFSCSSGPIHGYSALPVTIATGDFYIAQTTRAAVEALGAAVGFKPLTFDEILSLARQMIDSPAIRLPSTPV